MRQRFSGEVESKSERAKASGDHPCYDLSTFDRQFLAEEHSRSGFSARSNNFLHAVSPQAYSCNSAQANFANSDALANPAPGGEIHHVCAAAETNLFVQLDEQERNQVAGEEVATGSSRAQRKTVPHLLPRQVVREGFPHRRWGLDGGALTLRVAPASLPP